MRANTPTSCCCHCSTFALQAAARKTAALLLLTPPPPSLLRPQHIAAGACHLVAAAATGPVTKAEARHGGCRSRQHQVMEPSGWHPSIDVVCCGCRQPVTKPEVTHAAAGAHHFRLSAVSTPVSSVARSHSSEARAGSSANCSSSSSSNDSNGSSNGSSSSDNSGSQHSRLLQSVAA